MAAFNYTKNLIGHKEQAKPEPILGSTCVPAETSKTEEDKLKTSRIKIKIKHHAPEKSLMQSTGGMVNNGERVQEKPKPKDVVLALEAPCVTTDTPKVQPETRRIVEMKAMKLHEKGKKMPSSEDVQNEAEKSLQRSNGQQTTRNAELLPRCSKGKQSDIGHLPKAPEKSLKQSTAERNALLLLRCGKGKQFGLGHFQKAPEKSLKQSTAERLSDGQSVQEKTKPSNRDKEAIELKLQGTKRKLQEGYEQAQNARKKIQAVEFIDPQITTPSAKIQRAKEHMSQNIQSTEEDAWRNIIELPRSYLDPEEQAKPEPTLVSTCVPAETSKTEEDKPKARRIIKIKIKHHEPEKSLMQSTGGRVNNEERVQEMPKPKHVVVAQEASCVAPDTPSIQEDKPETRRIVETKAMKLHEKRKILPKSEDVQNEVEKSLQWSNGQQTRRNAELLPRCGKEKQFDIGHLRKALEKPLKKSKGEGNAELLLRCREGKQSDLGHFQKAPEKSLKQSTAERVSDGKSVQEKSKPLRDEEAFEMKLQATKRKLHEGYEQAQIARKKIQVVKFIDCPQTTTPAKIQRAKDHMRSQKINRAREQMRSQKAYLGCLK